METQETRDKLANAINSLKSSGRGGEVQGLVDAYKSKYRPEPSMLSKAGNIAGTILGSVAKPVEDVVRSAAAPVIAGGKSLFGGQDFSTEYSNILEKYKTAPSVTGIISGGNVQATGRDLSTSEGFKQTAGDIIQSVPIVKGASLAKSIAKTALPYLGKAGAAITAGAGLGYTTDVGMNLSEGKDVGESLTPGWGTAIGTAIPLAPYLVQGAGRIGKKTGEKISELVITKSMREADILQAYKAGSPLSERISNVLKGTSNPPQGAYKTSVETGLMGTKSMVGIQAKRASETLWKDLIAPRLKESDVKVNIPKFIETVKNKIIADNADPGRQKVLLEALDAVKDDFKGITDIDLAKLQEYKEGWAKFVPEKAYRGKPIGGAYNDVRNQLADESRQTIYSVLGDDVKQAYFDYGNLKGLQEMGVTSMTGQKLKGGSFTGMAELLSQAVTPIGTIAGRAVYKLSNGLEIVGKAGARTVEDALELNPQVLSQPIKTQPTQTTANQNNIVNSIDMPNTIPQKPSLVDNVVENSKRQLDEANKLLFPDTEFKKVNDNLKDELFGMSVVSKLDDTGKYAWETATKADDVTKFNRSFKSEIIDQSPKLKSFFETSKGDDFITTLSKEGIVPDITQNLKKDVISYPEETLGIIDKKIDELTQQIELPKKDVDVIQTAVNTIQKNPEIKENMVKLLDEDTYTVEQALDLLREVKKDASLSAFYANLKKDILATLERKQRANLDTLLNMERAKDFVILTNKTPVKVNKVSKLAETLEPKKGADTTNLEKGLEKLTDKQAERLFTLKTEEELVKLYEEYLKTGKTPKGVVGTIFKKMNK